MPFSRIGKIFGGSGCDETRCMPSVRQPGFLLPRTRSRAHFAPLRPGCARHPVGRITRNETEKTNSTEHILCVAVCLSPLIVHAPFGPLHDRKGCNTLEPTGERLAGAVRESLGACARDEMYSLQQMRYRNFADHSRKGRKTLEQNR